MPSLSVEGRVYPAGPVATGLSNLVFIIRLLFIAVIIGGGPEMLQRFGINNTPQWLLWMFENKVGREEGQTLVQTNQFCEDGLQKQLHL